MIEFEEDSRNIPQYDPALGAVLAVNKTMDEFDSLYGSRWINESTINHAKHCLDHVLNIQNYLISQPDGYYAKTYNLQEEVEHAITRLGMLWCQITREASEEASQVPTADEITVSLSPSQPASE